MTRDEFQRWQADPTTRWVFKALARAAAADKAEWERTSWDNGVASQTYLNELRTSASTMGDIVTRTYEEWAEWNGEQAEQ